MQSAITTARAEIKVSVLSLKEEIKVMTPEERAKQMLSRIYDDKLPGWPITRLQKETILAIQEAIREEREACIEITKHYCSDVESCGCEAFRIRKAIRERGE